MIRLRTLSLLVVCMIWSAAALPAWAAADAGPPNPLTMDPDLAIWTAIVFVVLLLVLYKFAWGPIAAGLDKREQSIAAQIEEARIGAEKANQALLQYQAKLASATEEVREMLAQARRDADAARERIVSEAQATAKRERERALAEINLAKETALREMAQKSVDIAVSLAGQIVRKQITPADHARLIQDSLEQFPSRN